MIAPGPIADPREALERGSVLEYPVSPSGLCSCCGGQVVGQLLHGVQLRRTLLVLRKRRRVDDADVDVEQSVARGGLLLLSSPSGIISSLSGIISDPDIVGDGSASVRNNIKSVRYTYPIRQV